MNVPLHVIPQEPPSDLHPRGGFHVLVRIPDKHILPMPFVAGSRKDLDDTLRVVKSSFTTAQQYVVDQWKDWCTNAAPADDCVVAYIDKHPLRVPFLNDLFLGQRVAPTRDVDGNLIIIAPERAKPRAFRAVTNPSVCHNGRKKPSDKTKEVLPYTIYDESGAVITLCEPLPRETQDSEQRGSANFAGRGGDGESNGGSSGARIEVGPTPRQLNQPRQRKKAGAGREQEDRSMTAPLARVHTNQVEQTPPQQGERHEVGATEPPEKTGGVNESQRKRPAGDLEQVKDFRFPTPPVITPLTTASILPFLSPCHFPP